MTVSAESSTITISPAFKLVLLFVMGLTAVTFITHVSLVLLADAEGDEQVRTLIGACSDAWKGGIAAILGLLAGKSL